MRQLGSGSGEGQHTITISHFRHMYRSRSRCPIKGAGSGQSAYVLMGVQRRKVSILPEHGGQAAPMVTQLGRRLTCSPPLAPKKGVQIEHRSPFQHIIDSPGELMGQDRQRLAFAMFFLESGEILLAGEVIP
jgi:hypothetical protein